MRYSIIGAGNMGGAIALGLLRSGAVSPCDLTVSHARPELTSAIKESWPEVTLTRDNSLCVDADTIFIAVKPKILPEILDLLRGAPGLDGKTIVSVVAAQSTSLIRDLLSEPGHRTSCTIFRVIPNTAISYGQSATFISSDSASENQMSRITELFGTMGACFPVQESQMGAMTALSSCGIAYALRYIQASVAAGAECGIDPALAREIVLQTVRGAVTVLQEGGGATQKEIDRVATPGGLTFRGLTAMTEGGFDKAVADGVKASLS